MKKPLILIALLLASATASAQALAPARWSESKAKEWYDAQPWLVGSNYIPATAINELEMWQADTFDPATIDKELGWAESLGMTTMRVFLHDLAWQQDPAGYRARIDRFLEIAAKHRIRPLFVLFDSCWDPDPRLGPQRAPTPGVHNSGWLQSPGAKALQDPKEYPRLRAYVTGVVGAFGKDPRVLAWDIWNEPDNTNDSSYGAKEPPGKVDLVLALLPKVFAWAREAGAEQPLTSGVWKGDWSADAKLSPMERVQLESSDVISFHNYDAGPEFEKRIKWLARYRRPILCTEYMARGNGSTFQGSLPIAKRYGVAAINWGFVAGRSQTFLPWDSWQKPYVNGREPAIWFHEIFRQDGTPYRQDEVDLIRSLTGAPVPARADAPVEEIFVVRSLRESRSAPTDYCAGSRTGFTGATFEDRYTFRSVATRTSDGRVVNADAGQVGTLHACFGPAAGGPSLDFFAEGTLGAVTFTGHGQCATPKVDYPEAGISALRCFLELGGLPAGYVGGRLTTNSVVSREVLGPRSDPPGYVQPSIATVRLWKARSSGATPLLADAFADHAVVQRDRPIRVFGQANPGESVSVSLGAASAQARADSAGAWTATLPAMAAGGPYTLVAKTPGGREQTASDILVGDVFLCSGQSNMEWPVSLSTGGAGAIAASADDSIRLLQVPHASSASPLGRFTPSAAWQAASPESVGPFSAVCYYFARELQKTVHVPLGLVHASWGGSNIETWFSAPGLRAVGGFDDRLDLLALYAKDPKAATLRLAQSWEAWWRSSVPAPAGSEPWQPGAPGPWKDAPAGLGDWKSWGVPELAAFDGMVWFRRTVRLTREQAASARSVSLGGIDEVDQTWVDGRAIGNTFGWGTERTYELPAGVLHEGDNTIVLNVLSTWASGGMLGPAGKMAVHLADGTAIPLAGGWQYQRVPPDVGSAPRAPWESVGGLTTIGNAMIAPLGPIALRGVLWYQGESNASAADKYEKLLAGLMADWRRTFGVDLPFLVVQLPNFGGPVTAPAASDWANLREAQRRAVSADAHAALAVTIDLGEAGELHPPNKQPVGVRLARAARHVVYGEAVSPSGPRPVRAERSQDGLVVNFEDVDGSLVVYSGRQPNAFEVCGADQESCRFATATVDGTRVAIALPDTDAVARVRYCWGDAPVCTLYDRSGLPVGPFEIDITKTRSSTKTQK